MTSVNVAIIQFYDPENDGAIKSQELQYFSVLSMDDYFFNLTEFCCHGTLFLWQHQHFMNIRCFINTVALTTFMWCLHKVSAHLQDKICCYA